MTRCINVHEHLQSQQLVPSLLQVMDAVGIDKTVLLGSSRFTFTLNPDHGFTRFDWNNEEILGIALRQPDRFEAWPTLSPRDPQKLEKLKSLHGRGATGLKLYLGHGYISPVTGQYLFHTRAMDDPGMLPVYAYCQDHRLPVCYHINPGSKTPGFLQEFLAVIYSFPELPVIAPHWALSSIRLSRLRELLDAFPNIVTDVSFGHDDYLKAGLKRISRAPERYREFVASYPDRVLFGSDIVITQAAHKTVGWIRARMEAYMSMLKSDLYETALVPDQQLRGLGLSGHLLAAVLAENYLAFRNRRPNVASVRRDLNWKAFGVTRVMRKPGKALPPLRPIEMA